MGLQRWGKRIGTRWEHRIGTRWGDFVSDPIAELFARLGGTGTWMDPLNGQTVFSDTAGTTQAVQGGLVARIDAPAGAPVQASFTNATASQRPLLRADGLEFDGVDDLLSYPDDPALRFGTTDFTIAFACKPDTITGAHAIWSKRGTGAAGTKPGWGLRQSGANLELEYDHPLLAALPNRVVAAGVFVIGSNTYGLVEINRTAATATARIGGVDRPSIALEIGDISGTLPLVIGSLAGFFDGLISRLLAIDKRLSAADRATVEQWLQAGFA